MAGRDRDADLLFEVQGPRGRRRMRLVTAAVLVVIAGGVVLGLIQLGGHGHLQPGPWLDVILPPVSPYLVGGLWLSLMSGLLAGLLAFPLAVVLAILRMSRNQVTSGCARWYIEITRAIPVLLVLYFVQLFLPTIGLRTPVFWQLILPLALYHISILAEIFRAGVESIPPGQREAAESLGMSPPRIYQQVILPQAVRVVLPTLITQFIRLFKDTALGYIVTYPELLTRGKIMGNYTGHLFETYAVVGLVYLVINLILAAAARALDRRLRTRRRQVQRQLERHSGDDEAALAALPAGRI
jgi:glutamate transport system permease protein